MTNELHTHHEELVKDFSKEQKQLLESSSQPILVYLDDMHKTANLKFVNLLGYKTLEEVNKIEYPLDEFFDGKTVEDLPPLYFSAMEHNRVTTVPVTFKKKDGERIEGKLTIVPIYYKGHQFALEFADV